MLTLLTEQIGQCERCGLYENGRCNPYFTKESKYCIIGEAPGENEVNNNLPFCGTAGKHLWLIMNEFGFKREDFLIINTVNCRPVKGNRNGKPTVIESGACSEWVRKYIKAMKPKAILTLGNYAKGYIDGMTFGIMICNAAVIEDREYDAPIVLSVHPSTCIYNGSRGKKMLYESVKTLRSVV